MDVKSAIVSRSLIGIRRRVHARQVLEHLQHRRVVVAEDIHLDQPVVQRIKVEVRRHGAGLAVVGGVLYRRELVDLACPSAI